MYFTLNSFVKEEHRNEDLPKARVLRDAVNLCIDRLIRELENEANSSKIVLMSIEMAQYLKLVKKGLNNNSYHLRAPMV